MTRRRHYIISITATVTAVGLVITLAVADLLPRPGLAVDWTQARLEATQAELGLVVHSVDIEGRNHTPDDALQEVLDPVRGTVMSGLDIVALQKQLREIAWVAEAEVARRLPDRLTVTLSEHEPFALWQDDGTLALVNRDGTILTRQRLARWRSLPLIVGDGAPQAAPALLEQLEDYPEFAKRVEAAVRVGERRWDLKLDGGLRLQLPADRADRDYGPGAALARLAALERRHRLLARAVTVIDLRLEDRIAVRLSPHGRAIGLAGGSETST